MFVARNRISGGAFNLAFLLARQVAYLLVHLVRKVAALAFASLLAIHTSALVAEEAPLIIGLDADMSAVAKEGGEAIRRGALIAINEINSQGGVLGRPLSLLIKDHRGNPARGINNIKQFAQTDNLVAVLGGVHTPVAIKELPYIHEHNIIYLDPWAAGTSIVDNDYDPNYVFRVSVRDEQAGKVLIQQTAKRGFSKVALLLERTGWGRSNLTSLTEAAGIAGTEIVDQQWFNWGQQDLEKELQKIINSGAEAIILVANAPEGAAICKELLRVSPDAPLPIISHWGIASGSFVEMLGLENLKRLDLSVLQTYSFATPSNPAVNDRVLKAYGEQFGDTPPHALPGAVGTAHAYDLVHLLAIAIRNAESDQREKIRDALESIDQYAGLVKNYQPPFSDRRHDALWAEDYIIAHYNSLGYLVPQLETQKD